MKVVMPDDGAAALAGRSAHPDAVPVAGGTDLLVRWPEQTARHDRTYLDLSGVAELRHVTWTDGALVLGATATYWDVLADAEIGRVFPMLHTAAAAVGAVQIQARGTWGGNIANGSPAADGVPVLMAYDATVELASARGRRTVPLDRLYRGYRALDLATDELIWSIRIPRRSYGFARFVKVGSRRAQAITKVGVALARSDAGWRVVANSVAPTVCRCPALEARLADDAPVRSPDDLAPAVARDVAPIDDMRSTAAYRRSVLARIIHRAIATPGPV